MNVISHHTTHTMKTNLLIKKLFLLIAFVVTGLLGYAQAGPVNVGVLPPGKVLKVQYKVTVKTGLPSSVTQVSSQGTVTGDNALNVLTDDPDNTTSNTDPTLTPLDEPPHVTSIERKTPNTAAAINNTSVTYLVTFSEPVSGVDASDFTLTSPSNGVTGTVAPVANGPSATYDVTVTSIAGDGTLRLDVNASGTGIKDNGNLDLSNGFTTGDVYTFDHTTPTVTVSQNAGQADPTNASPINFTVVFSEPVNGFATGDVTLDGTAGATTATVTEAAPMNGTTYNVAVSGMTGDGTVIASLAAGVASDAAGNGNAASTSTDNSVGYDATKPSVTIAKASAQDDPTGASTIHFTAVFSEHVNGFTASDITLGGTAGGTFTAIITEVAPMDGTTFDVAVSGMSTTSGTVTASVGANVVTDDADNANSASPSTASVNWVACQIICPANVFVDAVAGACSAVATWDPPSSTGNCGTLTLDHQSGEVFPVGETTVHVSSASTGQTCSFTVTVNDPVPTVTSVAVPANGAYKLGANLDFTVNFSITETVTGTPQLALTIGSTTRYAQYLSGSGTPALVFRYTVANTDLDGDGITIGALSTNGGTIKNGCNTNADLTLNAVGATTGVLVDGVVPTLNPVTIASDGASPSRAKVGDKVTGTFTASETIQTPAVTIAGHAVMASHTSGNQWKAEYTMQAGDAEGQVAFTIDFSDPAGNAGTQVSTTTNNSLVTFDKTVPTLTSVTVASDNSYNTSLAKVGDVVTLSFTASETIQPPVVTIAGHNPTSLTNLGGNNWEATYTMLGGDNEGTVPVFIAFNDLAINGGTPVVATTDGSSVTFDRTVPTLSNVHIQSNNANNQLAKPGDVVTLSFTASEAINGAVVNIAGHTLPTGSISHTGNNYTATYTMQGSDATGQVSFVIGSYADLAGNVGSPVSNAPDGSLVFFDKTVPTLSPVTIASSGTDPAWAKVGDKVAVTFTASETIMTPSVSIAGHSVSAINITGDQWKGEYTMQSSDAEGPVAFTINVSDLAGNAGGQVSTTTDVSGVTFDKTPPAAPLVRILSNNLNNNHMAKVGDLVQVQVGCNEPLGTVSGTIATQPVAYFRGMPPNPNFDANYIMAQGDAEGVVPFSIAITDRAGNQTILTSTTNGSSVTFDKTAPAVTSINRQNPSAQGTTKTTLVYRVTFSENVSGVDVSDFALTQVNAIGTPGTVNITGVTPTGPASVYDVTATVSTVNGAEVRLDLKASGTGITDAAGNGVITGFTTGQTYILGQPPTFTTCPSSTGVTVNTDAGRCDATLSKTTLLSYVAATGYPAPTLTVKVGATVVDDTHPYTFPKGGKTVTVTAANGIGSPATCSFTLTVVDNQPPVINTVAKPMVLLWSPNHKYQTVKASQFVTSVSDNCGNISTASVLITKVTSDEPDDLPGSSDGSTTQDIKIASNCTSVDLRSERQDNGNGRVYTLYLKVSDSRGNTGTATARAIAPINQSGTTAVDNGPAYTVLSNCFSNTLTATAQNGVTSRLGVPQAPALQVRAMPNPTTHQFTLQLKGGAEEGGVELRVMDVLGRLVEARKGIASNTSLQIGANYRPGIYVVEAVQGNERVTLKLIKQPD